MSTYHAHNIEAFVTEAINAGDNVENYDLDAIIEELQENGVWNGDDAQSMEDDKFWEIIANHGIES